jgi:hypothetical protein
MTYQSLPWAGMFDPPKIKPIGARVVDPDAYGDELEEARHTKLRHIETAIMELMKDGQIRSGEEISQHVGVHMRVVSGLLSHLLMQSLLRRVSGVRKRWVLA